MDNVHISKILNLLSESRVSPFRLRHPEDKDTLKAYEWSLTLGQALLKPIGISEVAVRNALDRAICVWWDTQGYPGTWTDIRDIEPPITFLAPFVHATEWRNRAKSNKPCADIEITHDDIIAHTSLGTWRNMIGNPAAIPSTAPENSERALSWRAARQQDVLCAELWKQVTKDAFPLIPKTKRLRLGLSPRGYIGARLTRISALRNRVCHWDNLMAVDVNDRYDDMRRIVGAIDSDLQTWFDEQCREQVEKCLAEKPNASIN